jgi:PPOX class probable F420-dependent enzyme
VETGAQSIRNFSADVWRCTIGGDPKEALMALKQGDLALLEHPVAKELLVSNIPARVAYLAPDGTPRVTPIWFHWDGRELVLGTAPNAAKAKAMALNPKVAVTIDTNDFPHKVLQIRGTAHLQTIDGVAPEYAQAAQRYLGQEQGKAWVEQVSGKRGQQVRIAITPEWVGVLDFETRLPRTLTE